MTATADLILCEYQRRLTHIDKRQPEHGSVLYAQVNGELMGLHRALGIALGGQIPSVKADELATARYAQWKSSEEASAAACCCSLCAEEAR